jgi:hypothetical protein
MSGSHAAPGAGAGQPPGKKAIAIGALCAALISLSFPYANLVVRGSRPANTSLPFGVVVICFVVAAVNPLLRRLHCRLALSRQDLLLVFVMVLIAAAVPTWGLIGQLLPIMAGANYYATPENHWEEQLVRHAPAWIGPGDPEASRQFYEGLGPASRTPWGAWATPLGAWAVLVGAFYAATVGIMLLLRRPWVDQEHLIYPLMRLPVELADVEEAGRVPPLLRNPVLWLGVGLALAPMLVNGLHFHVPSVPFIRLRQTLRIPVESETLVLPLWFNFAVMGFAYVVSSDLGFSLVLFALIAAVQTPLMRLWGVSLGAHEIYCAGSPAVSYQTMGAMIVLVGAGLWSAREHLRRSWRDAWRGVRDAAHTAEPAHPRLAWLLCVGGLAAMALWLVASGLPLLPTLVFLFASFINFMALTRATVQGGVPVTRAALIPQSFTAFATGTKLIGPRGLTSLGYAFAWTADIRVILMTFFAHALKLWSESEPRRRGLLAMTALAIVISAAGALWLTLHFAYAKGGVTLSAWLFQGNPLSAFRYASSQIQTPVEPSLSRFAYLGIGAGIMAGLSLLHRTLMWWPLHPLGFAVASTQPVQDLWISILIGWVLKTLTMRYGGFRLYQRALPLLLGVILGQSLGCAGWLVVDGILGKTGNMLVAY